MFAAILLGALLGAIVLGVVIGARWGERSRRPLRWTVFALTAVAAIVLIPFTVADSGTAAVYLLGVPVLAAAVPVLADLTGTLTIAADVISAVVLTGWAVLLALGIGTAFLPGALLLVVVVGLDMKRRRVSVE